MTNEIASERNGEGGFAFWRILLLIVLIGFIAAVVMKLMSVWVAIGFFVLAAFVIGLLANIPDIIRYMRISSM
jgi:hypothetical protein